MSSSSKPRGLKKSVSAKESSDQEVTLADLSQMFVTANTEINQEERRDWLMAMFNQSRLFLESSRSEKCLSEREKNALRIMNAWCLFSLSQLDAMDLADLSMDDEDNAPVFEEENIQEIMVKIPLALEYIGEIGGENGEYNALKEYLSLLLDLHKTFALPFEEEEAQDTEKVSDEDQDFLESKFGPIVNILRRSEKWISESESRSSATAATDAEGDYEFPPQIFPFVWNEQAAHDHLSCYLWQVCELYAGNNEEEDEDEEEEYEDEDEDENEEEDEEEDDEEEDYEDEDEIQNEIKNEINASAIESNNEIDDLDVDALLDEELDESHSHEHDPNGGCCGGVDVDAFNRVILAHLYTLILSLKSSEETTFMEKSLAHIFLADCISTKVMQDEQVEEATTTDSSKNHLESKKEMINHFEQAEKLLLSHGLSSSQGVSVLVQTYLEWAYCLPVSDRKSKFQSACKYIDKGLSMPEGDSTFGHLLEWRKMIQENNFIEPEETDNQD